jgi:hypothetical protein
MKKKVFSNFMVYSNDNHSFIGLLNLISKHHTFVIDQKNLEHVIWDIKFPNYIHEYID